MVYHRAVATGLASRFRRLLGMKELVGVDEIGTKYFRRARSLPRPSRCEAPRARRAVSHVPADSRAPGPGAPLGPRPALSTPPPPGCPPARRWEDRNDNGDVVERRECRPADPVEWDINDLPPAWRQWLHGARDHPPTAEELRRIAEHRETVRARAAALQREEEQRRMRSRGSAAGEAGGPDVDAFLRQISKSGQGQKVPGDKWDEPVQAGRGSGDTFEADAWRPGGK